jgi:hypothetical protein
MNVITLSGSTAPNNDGMNSFQQLMSSMVNRMAEQGLNSPPEERFRVQLETLTSMGFVDRQANIQGKLNFCGFSITKSTFTVLLQLETEIFYKKNYEPTLSQGCIRGL